LTKGGNEESSGIPLNAIKVTFSPISALETVITVQCSTCHVLVLTSIGSLYSCGDGSDGQLGHDSLDSCSYFRHIDWFTKQKASRITITTISAGANDSCSHSAAIDNDGVLYTWGKATITGHIGAKQSADGALDAASKQPVKEASSITSPRAVECLKVGTVVEDMKENFP